MQRLFKNLNQIWNKFKGINNGFWEELEEELISSDVSMDTALKIIRQTKEEAGNRNISTPDQLKMLLKKQLTEIVSGDIKNNKLAATDKKPLVFLVVGVNGAGKTTTIAKIANMYKNAGKKVLIAAADTYRSAAVEQMAHFAEKLNIEMVHHQRNSDPGAVVYDSLEKAMARGYDLVIVDTAGRMQTSFNLMEELKKIKKVIFKKIGRDADEILIVIDSTTGQNSKVQAQMFNEAIGLTGIILTKIDSSSKGGIIFTIKNDLGIPVKLLADGEKITDIKLFEAQEFIDMMFPGD